MKDLDLFSISLEDNCNDGETVKFKSICYKIIALKSSDAIQNLPKICEKLNMTLFDFITEDIQPLQDLFLSYYVYYFQKRINKNFQFLFTSLLNDF